MAIIVLLEDDPAVGMLLQTWMRNMGHEVTWIRNGIDGVDEAIGNHMIQLVVSDLMMPGATGEEVTLAFMHFSPDVPVLIVTGCTDQERLDKVREQKNVVRVLGKPITSEQLENAIIAILAVWSQP